LLDQAALCEPSKHFSLNPVEPLFNTFAFALPALPNKKWRNPDEEKNLLNFRRKSGEPQLQHFASSSNTHKIFLLELHLINIALQGLVCEPFSKLCFHQVKTLFLPLRSRLYLNLNVKISCPCSV